MTHARSSLLLVLLLTTPVLGQELTLIGTHPLEGREAGADYSGSLIIHADATYTIRRSFTDGTRQELNGSVHLDDDQLVLTRRPGAAGVLGGEAGAAEERFRRDDTKERVRWAFVEGEDFARFVSGKTESSWEHIRRSLKQGKEWRWLLRHNRGFVDKRDDNLWISRSRQPEPRHIERFQREGGRTVLSLNGDQDKEAWRSVRVRRRGRLETRREKVNLQAFIDAQGLERAHVKMGSKRVPSDADLVTVFRVLLDDSKKPILLHCTGGADRTGVIGALYQIEFLGWSKEEAKKEMRRHMWTAHDGTEVQGAYVDLYQKGTIRRLLREAGVEIPERYREP